MEAALTDRQQLVLRIIIREYIRTAAPVGSKALVETYGLNVSPATIRNEMAVLEELGYLTHPYTSAGRLPTERGYRYFVEKLMEEADLPLHEQRMIQHQFHQARLELDQWMRLSAAVLAHTMKGASLVTAPKTQRCHLKQLDLVSIRDDVALLIVVLQGGTLKQQILNLPIPLTQDELRPLANRLTEQLAGLDANDVVAVASTMSGLAAEVGQIVIDTMRRVDSRVSSDVYHDGLLNILQEPEFLESLNLQQVIQALEERRLIDQLVAGVLRHGGVQIIIGGEGRWDELSDISIVLARYGAADGISGALGVLGPLRMPYGRAVSVVRYMSELMSDLLSDLYGRSENIN
ncbi:MAG: heat-inducible transcriptional repressor HrcA [Anaerolineae bacterium]